MKPSKLMLSMLALLLVGHKTCFFLRGAFLKRLPADVRAHLLRDDFSDPISLALKADEIYHSRMSSNPVYAVSSAPKDTVNPVRSSASSRPPRSAGRETSSPAGGCLYPTCRAFYFISFNLFHSLSSRRFLIDSGASVCFSSSTFLVQLIRGEADYRRWFLSLLLRFSSHSSTVRESQV